MDRDVLVIGSGAAESSAAVTAAACGMPASSYYEHGKVVGVQGRLNDGHQELGRLASAR